MSLESSTKTTASDGAVSHVSFSERNGSMMISPFAHYGLPHYADAATVALSGVVNYLIPIYLVKIA